MLKHIRNHTSHSILAFGTMAIGLWLMENDRFFQWPPHYIWLENDDAIGAVFVCLGLSVLWWVLDDERSPRWNGILLTLSASLFAFLTAYEFLIWVATGAYQSWISNAIVTAFVVILARRRDTRDE